MTRAWGLGLGVLAALAGGGGILGYYGYEGARYVSTGFASVVTPAASLSAPAAGTVTRLTARPDAVVSKGEVLGRVTQPDGRVVAVRSPIAGRVTVTYAVAGDTVMTGQVLGEVGALGESVIVGEVPETEAVRLRVGQAVTVRLADDPSLITGTLTRIGRATLVAAQNGPGPVPLTTANATEYVPITVSFPKTGTRLVSGMSATLEVHV